MPRLPKPDQVDPQKQRLARELLALQAEARARRIHDAYIARSSFDAGIPAAEIAQTYGVTLDAAYKLINRVPDCYNQHGATEACTACGSVNEGVA